MINMELAHLIEFICQMQGIFHRRIAVESVLYLAQSFTKNTGWNGDGRAAYIKDALFSQLVLLKWITNNGTIFT